MPDPSSFFSSDIKVYTTKVTIDRAAAGAATRHDGEVEILVDHLDKVLTVPVLAVLEFNGKDHVTKKVDDRFVQTEVEAGPLEREIRRRSTRASRRETSSR